MRFLLPLLALTFSLGLTACDSNDDDNELNITATVVADSDLSTLEAAVVEAGLDGDLASSDTRYTVFAPTNAAFLAALDALDITATELLAREDLGSILQLHVVADAELDADDLTDGRVITTLNGQTLTVVISGGRVGLDTEDADTEANVFVTTADIDATNGVVHKIDGVLLPAASN